MNAKKTATKFYSLNFDRIGRAIDMRKFDLALRYAADAIKDFEAAGIKYGSRYALLLSATSLINDARRATYP